MATIDSLDLATLTNNPQSIAEALEDALEVTSGNIGQLKTDAQNAKDDIDDLKTSAQADHDNIESFLEITNLESHRYTTFLNSWIAHNTVASTTSENGITIQRMGPLYIASVNIYKNNVGSVNPTVSEHILTLDSNITNPTNIVYMGTQHFSQVSHDDYVGLFRIESDGKVKINYRNVDSNEMIISGNFIGLDV